MTTLQNVVDYLQANGIDLFEGCTTPEPISIDTVKDYIMLRCGLLTPAYSEPELFKQQVQMWFKKEEWEFAHLVKILLAEYNIIDNVDEWDWWKEEHSGTDARAYGGSDTLTHGETHTLSGTDTLTHGETHTLSGTDTTEYDNTVSHTGDNTDTDTTGTEHKVSAFNTSTYQADSQDTNSGSVVHNFDTSDHKTGEDTLTHGRTDTASGDDKTQYGKVDTASGNDKTEYGKTDDLTHGEIIEYNRHRHGNIGTVAPQDIIQKELDLLERFNVYDWIARKFERDNMIQVY